MSFETIEPADRVRMSGYRPHDSDLIEDPHYWQALLGNPHDVLCSICGEMQIQNPVSELPVWITVREGKR